MSQKCCQANSSWLGSLLGTIDVFVQHFFFTEHFRLLHTFKFCSKLDKLLGKICLINKKSIEKFMNSRRSLITSTKINSFCLKLKINWTKIKHWHQNTKAHKKSFFWNLIIMWRLQFARDLTLLFMWTGKSCTTMILNFKLLQTIFKNKGVKKISIFHLTKKKRLKLKIKRSWQKESEVVQRKWSFKKVQIQKRTRKNLDFLRWKRLDTNCKWEDRKWKESKDSQRD